MSTLAPQPLRPLIGVPPYLRFDLAYYGQTLLNGGLAIDATANQIVIIGGRTAWILLSVYVELDTTAAVLTRIPILQIRDPSQNVRVSVPAPSGSTAGQGTGYTWFPDAGPPVGAVNTQQMMPIPTLVLAPAWQLLLACSPNAAGDVFTHVMFTYINVPTGPPLDAAPAIVESTLRI